MPQFILTAIGSYGDVHPLVGLGTALAARGHTVKLVTNPYFEEMVTGAGLPFVPISTREEYIELSQHPDLWHPIWGPMLVLRHAAGRLARPLYERAVEHYVPGETVFCAHGLDLGTRVAAEKLGAPIASIDLAPAMLWSVHDSPRLKGALLGPRVPKWLKRTQYWMSDTLFVRRILGEPLNGLRRDVGLPPVGRVFAQWLHATDLVLGLFPEWFAAPQADWPANTRLVGFPLWDAPGSVPNSCSSTANGEPRNRKLETDPFAPGLADDLREFLSTGGPPIAFSPGSAHRAAHAFFVAAVEACRMLGRRGILLTKYAEQLPKKLPDGVGHFGFVPLSRLLPHTAAFVHHGGIGSCAQGLAAGVPQIVQPMSFDQFDNARRLARLGVAVELSVRRFRGPALAEALARLFESRDTAARCRQIVPRCDGPAALAAACGALEALAAVPAAR
jgi:UDP:flavonoid glycosyltransferase YjiC (YdhE family)